jgi:endoplasmic reticulum-Golgi intermediate compartment protein 3
VCTTNVQVRSAYRRKGWAFGDPQQIEQCARESYSQKLREQVGEGCHMWGRLDVKKVY